MHMQLCRKDYSKWDVFRVATHAIFYCCQINDNISETVQDTQWQTVDDKQEIVRGPSNDKIQWPWVTVTLSDREGHFS